MLDFQSRGSRFNAICSFCLSDKPEPLKGQAKLQQTTLLLFLPLPFEENKLDVSCESSAKQRIHMKYQELFCFSMKKYSRLSSSPVLIGTLIVNTEVLFVYALCVDKMLNSSSLTHYFTP